MSWDATVEGLRKNLGLVDVGIFSNVGPSYAAWGKAEGSKFTEADISYFMDIMSKEERRSAVFGEGVYIYQGADRKKFVALGLKEKTIHAEAKKTGSDQKSALYVGLLNSCVIAFVVDYDEKHQFVNVVNSVAAWAKDSQLGDVSLD